MSTMEQILEFVSDENKSWVESLTPKNIASVLNTIAMVPHMKIKFIKSNESDIAAIKGLVGETKFDNIISQHMSNDYELINTAKIGKAGDFIIKWRSQKTNRIYSILIDVKNYSKSTVPTSEVEKFYRDVNMNNVDGGFLISLKSRIIGCSKIIELKDFSTDNEIIPVLFTQSSEPLVIVEVIKLLFHIIEIKDLNKNNVSKNDELISHINSLNDNIQIITDCREVLQSSKSEIEKSLNTIMLKLMSCEYNLVSKINQINTTLIHVNALEHNVSSTELTELSDQQSDQPTSLDVVKTVRDLFSSLISDESEPLLYNIYELGWDDTCITIPKKTFSLIKGDTTIVVKFLKSGMTITFPDITEDMTETIQSLTRLKKIRNTSAGIVIKIGSDTITHITVLHGCI
jgi:hypothetical protein